jgi:uncharacterized membrane protein YfcA
MDPLLLAAIAIGFAQVVKGITGFGSALVAMPVLVMLYGPREALPLMAGVDCLVGFVLLPGAARLIDWRLVGMVFVPMCVGQYLGTALLLTVPERPIAMTLGVLVLLLGGGLVINPVPSGWGELEAVPEERSQIVSLGMVAGALGGVLQGTVGAAGPPIVAWVRRYFSDAFGRAQLIAVFMLGSLVLSARLAYLRGDVATLAPKIAFLALPMVGGALLGQWLAPRVPREAFGRGVGALLALAGLALLLR